MWREGRERKEKKEGEGANRISCRGRGKQGKKRMKSKEGGGLRLGRWARENKKVSV